MSIHDEHRRRLKKEFLARPDSFPDHKLLELVLFYSIPRRDTNPIAHELMDRFVSLSGVLDANIKELEKTPGVGEHTVVMLKAFKELSSRYLSSRTSMEEIVQSTEDAGALLQPYFFGVQSERVCVLCMDGKGKNLGVRMVGEGSVNAISVTARAVVEAALGLNAARIILAHNHVSGLALPSAEDKETTLYLEKVLSTVGVQLDDHLIFADDDMVSMRESHFPFMSQR